MNEEKLEQYKRKREFTKTSEPAGGSRDGDNNFVIHRHAARNLHFDLRLAHGGVLVSWAVPKGVPTIAGEKRLAIHVEDHPLDYQDFDGEIPEGNYGAGTVEIWDNGIYQSKGDFDAGLKKGHLDISFAGNKIVGNYALIRLAKPKGEDQWLIFMSADQSGLNDRLLTQGKNR